MDRGTDPLGQRVELQRQPRRRLGQRPAEPPPGPQPESGVIRIGINPNFPNMSTRNDAGDWEGFDIDVDSELAKDLCVKVVFVSTEWKTLVSGMVAGKYDISTSASITAS